MKLEAAIAVLEEQRSVLGDGVVDAALGPMQKTLAAFDAADAVREDDGERKIVTVIFADLSGSTALGEVMDPEEIRALLNNCFDRLVPVVKHFGGTVDKFQGDNIMALFGAPVAHENDPERALRACLGMMQALDEFNKDMGVDLGFHIGVNTGLVIAGGVGSAGDQSYSVMGDTVNVAARLEAAAVRGEIIVGPDTYRLAEPFFGFEDREAISVKGRDEPVKIYQLLSVRAGHHSTRGIAGLSSPMIGRDTELEGFLSGLAALADGQGGLVGIIAAAGVGKSRFIAEAQAASSVGIEWVVGAALAYSTDTPYALAADLMRDMLGVAADTPLDEVSGSLAGKLAMAMSADEAEAEWPFLARLLDLPLAKKGAAAIDQYAGSPEVLVQRTQDAFTKLVTAVAAEPLVLVWEDLHWADAPSLRLLDRLIRLTSDLSLLLVLMFRPGDSTISDLYQQLADDQTPGLETIELSPLSPDDSILLVDGLLKIENLPETARDLILDRAQGNPLFLEELLRSLIDAGMVVVEAGKATATDSIHDLEAIDIPDTIHGVIGARIDRLPTSRKTTLESASVIGRVFQHQVLDNVTTGPIEEDLGELERLEFITPEYDEYLFKHVFTQESAYNGLLLSRRRELHATAAQAIESLFPDRLDELSATLARHYENANKPDQAVPYFLQAAQRAADAYANEDALALAARGLELIDDEDRKARAEFLLLRERVLDVVGERDQQSADLEALTTLAESLSDDALLLESALRRADLLVEFGEFDNSLEAALEALELAELLDDPVAICRARLTAGFTLTRLAKFREAEDQLRLGLTIAKNHDLAEQQMLLLQRIAAVAFGRKDHAESRTRLEAALGLAEKLDSTRAQGVIHQNLGIMTIHLCDFDYCREHFNRAVHIAQKMGWKALESGAIASLGEANRLDGRLEDALDNSRVALTIAQQIEAPFWIASQHRAVADALVELGRADEAVAEAAQAVAQWRGMGSTPHLMDCIATLSRAKKGTGDLEGAMSAAEEAVQLLLEGGDVTGAAYPFLIYETCLDLLKAINDPRFDELLTQASEKLDNLYPDGGCLPWMKNIKQHAGTDQQSQPVPRP